jgi:outer membrane lipopolysaccharide assembly protein LptE/RlpB
LPGDARPLSLTGLQATGCGFHLQGLSSLTSGLDPVSMSPMLSVELQLADRDIW